MSSKLIKVNASTQDAVSAILDVARISAVNDPFIKTAARIIFDVYGHEGVALNQWLDHFCTFVVKAAPFVPDPKTRQQIRTPSRTMMDGAGNCVDYTVLLSSLALSLNLPVTIVTASFDGRHYLHIYPRINGVTCDLVLEQLEDGSELKRRPFGKTWNLGAEAPAVNTILWSFQ